MIKLITEPSLKFQKIIKNIKYIYVAIIIKVTRVLLNEKIVTIYF